MLPVATDQSSFRGDVVTYVFPVFWMTEFLARDVIYTSRTYATMSVCDGSELAHYS